ncbi:MAG: anti-sigma F factor [Clostridia bacterium]|jgi:stage II sporulation protein AB (anti-sigma F factor)|nr:anti-sigma F factor [Clostridia bacterium]
MKMDKIVNNKIKLEFMSIGENVALARITVAALVSQLEITLNDLEEIKVAVSEAVSNAIIHGYQNKPDGIVTLSASLKGHTLILEIEDHGVGIADIQKAMEPAFSTDPERTGLGFVFMQSFMDEVKVFSQVGSGTKVILTKQISADLKNIAVS